VVKVLRPGFPAEEADAEAEIATLVGRTDVAAPRFLGTTSVDGRAALIYERLDGPSMLDQLSGRPWRIGGLAREFAALHAVLHRADGTGLPDLKARYARMIERADGLPADARDASLRRLAALEDGTAICHGDMHPGNVLMSAAGTVVIDWITAGIGPPAADLARTTFLIRDSAIPPGISFAQRTLISGLRSWFLDRYLRHYWRLAHVDDRQVQAWRLPVLAVRLGEGIEAERARLLSLIRREVARAEGDAG
jgi:aminoglycoside phosphotransferase (APT) family kinase protein